MIWSEAELFLSDSFLASEAIIKKNVIECSPIFNVSLGRVKLHKKLLCYLSYKAELSNS